MLMKNGDDTRGGTTDAGKLGRLSPPPARRMTDAREVGGCGAGDISAGARRRLPPVRLDGAGRARWGRGAVLLPGRRSSPEVPLRPGVRALAGGGIALPGGLLPCRGPGAEPPRGGGERPGAGERPGGRRRTAAAASARGLPLLPIPVSQQKRRSVRGPAVF